jgi:hypothetical protein
MSPPRERAASNKLLPVRGAYFTSAQVEHVRCFGEPQTLSLAGATRAPVRWTIILGENGVGKTTLLQLLALASGGARYDRYMFEPWEFDEGPGPPLEFSRGRGKRGRIGAELLVAGRRVETELQIGDEGSYEGGAPLENAPLVCGYGAGRRLGAGRLSRHRRHLRVKHASLFVDVPLRNAEEWLLGEDYAAAKEGRAGGPAQRRLDRLKELLTHLLPDVTDVRVGEPHKRWEPSVEFKTPYGWVPLYGLSLGYQSLVAWMVDLAATMFDRYESHVDPLGEPVIVLVDEIDLHLHPKWQRDLMRFLTERFPNAQFIATAHSPLVVQAAEDANVVLLKRDGDQVAIENNPADVRNWRIDQILTSDLYGLPTARPPRLDKLIAERRTLLTKSQLTTADERRMRTIETKIGDLPAGETPDEQRAMALILRASERLKPLPSRKKA